MHRCSVTSSIELKVKLIIIKQHHVANTADKLQVKTKKLAVAEKNPTAPQHLKHITASKFNVDPGYI
jgi:hypothetical protein